MSIKIHFSFVFYIIILFFSDLLICFIPFFISILIHEITHGIIGIIFGMKIKNINIEISGLNIGFENFDNSVNKKILILLSGPIANLVILAIFYIINKEEYLFIILINLFLFIFNLIPIYPLDGGKIVYEIFNKYFKHSKSLKIINNIYYVFAIMIIFISAYMCINYKNVQIFILTIYLLTQLKKGYFRKNIIL